MPLPELLAFWPISDSPPIHRLLLPPSHPRQPYSDTDFHRYSRPNRHRLPYRHARTNGYTLANRYGIPSSNQNGFT